jgi:MFS family permease
MPPYIQIVGGQPALQAGLLLAVQGVGAMIIMPIAGKLTDKIGSGKIVLAGVALFAIGIFSLTRLTGDTPFRYIQLELFLYRRSVPLQGFARIDVMPLMLTRKLPIHFAHKAIGRTHAAD